MLKLFIFLQAAGDLANTETEIERESLVGLITQGGPLGITIVSILLFMSVIGIYIFFERHFALNRASKFDESFMNNIRANVQAGNIASAKALCQTNNTPVARMVEKGIQRIGKPLKDINAAIENVGNLELFKLEKGLSTLASIAGAAPMVGFLGTVTGMILSFYKMSSEQNVSPDVLAGGIYQALITTALGLVIGIFAFVGYNLLVARIENIVFKMERSTVEFMDMLQEPGL
jgi:biopolymer transport protein ExbB